ncbi:hypothetical protein [Shewanella surugensis]|uniref:Lipoprotein n=1 Tax=Shewanella surugensis TaxID=212020 RepID=A0ABT0L9G5_9GAMM|nr:hypothetical protein [Shewanella surugensis]MCL1124343.1 hypothetical protein [Shewanella surugensis]
MNKLIFLVLFTPLLFACSNKPIRPQDFSGQITDSFITSIADDGLKLFTYRVSLSSIEENMSPEKARKNNPAQMSKNRNEQLPSKMQRKQTENSLELLTQQTELGLKKTLEMTDFCRKGYIELYRLIEDTRGMIRGECLEGANTLDKQKFGS